MTRRTTLLGVSLWALTLLGSPLRASHPETATVESAAEVLQALSSLQLKCIPPALLHDAQGVAIIPNVLKAGLGLGGRFGRGVILIREADGRWSNPLFITLVGGGIGWQVGIQSTDVVLVFKTRNSLDQFLRGKSKLTLGVDVAVAAGPVGRQAEAGTDAQLKAEIFSYSRSRGLFAGVSLEGAGIRIDCGANEAFYHVRGGHPADLLSWRGVPVPLAAENLKALLAGLSTPGGPPAVIVPLPRTPLTIPGVPPPPPPR